jgi:8-oxo-dGTP pyrophosphatase MutT (NUDIX family)
VAILFGGKVKILTITQAQITERLRQSYHADTLPSTDGYVGRPAEQTVNPLKCAAVLIPLTFYADEWHLLFTRRADTLNDHSGQVAFPGGHCDAEDETLEETALREADEEIGLKAKDIQILGRINEVRTVTNYRITPVVGVFPWAYAFFVSTIEVARVFTMPLNWLADPKNYWQFQHPKATHPTIAYQPYDGELLWGATARITVNFLKTVLKA